MARLISIEELEASINLARRTWQSGGGLSPALQILAEVYGKMIYDHARWLDIDQLSETARLVADEWLTRPGSSASIVHDEADD